MELKHDKIYEGGDSISGSDSGSGGAEARM